MGTRASHGSAAREPLVVRCLLALAAVLGLSGCSSLAPVQTAYINSVNKAAAKRQCAATIQLENRTEQRVRMVSEEACVDLTGNTVALPSDLKLWVNGNENWDNYRVCRDNTVATDADEVVTCQWNGTFRHTYPWTITLRSYDGALRSQVQAVRVFRNGELAFVWVPKPDDASTKLVISGTELKGKLLPENAPMDLRIIPTGVQVDASALAATVQAKPSQWDIQFKAARDAVLSSPSLANGTLREQTACIAYRVRMVNYYAAQIAGSAGQQPVRPNNCTANPPPPQGDSLSKRYGNLKEKTKASIDAVQAKFLQDINAYRSTLSASEQAALATFEQDARAFWDGKGAWWQALNARGKAHTDADRQVYLKWLEDPAQRRLVFEGKPPAVQGTPAPSAEELAWLQTRGTPAELELLLSQADSLVSQGLRAVDDTIALEAQLRKDVVRIANSTDEQARLLLRVANSLQGTSPLQPLQQNPEMLTGERGLGMHYSDRWQFFAFAPWTAFPVSFKGDPDFTAANLIPIVDVLGWRYQFASSRMADIRAGIGGTALSFTAEEKGTDESGATVKKDVQHLRAAPEVNLGIGNVKVGLSYLFVDHLDKEQRWRVLVGADLYKLISGNNIEAATF